MTKSPKIWDSRIPKFGTQKLKIWDSRIPNFRPNDTDYNDTDYIKTESNDTDDLNDKKLTYPNNHKSFKSRQFKL